MYFRGYNRLSIFTIIICLFFIGTAFGPQCCTLSAQVANPYGSIRGRVTDLQTGEPIAKASVSIREQGRVAITDEGGKFELSGVHAGTIELDVSIVGYGLLRKQLDVASGSTVDVELHLGQEALKRYDQITVSVGPFAPVDADASTQYALDNTEIRNLSTVLADDPLRAVQNLPGVVGDQDFYSEFALRGTGMRHIGVFIDGVLVDQPVHAVQDQGDLGSLSIINGDLVESMSLMSGAFPVKYGDRTGAVLDVETRQGDRDRISTRVNANFLGTSGTLEGPLGTSKKASWVVSVRKSYLDYLMNRLDDTGGLALGYEDAEGNLSYDLNEHHKLSATVIWGGSMATRDPINFFGEQNGFFTKAHNATELGTFRWTWMISPNDLAQSQVFLTRKTEHDRNESGQSLVDSTSSQFGFREDFTHQFSSNHKLEMGASGQRDSEQLASQSIWNYTTDAFTPKLSPLANFSTSEWRLGSYVQDTLTLFHQRLTIQGGGREDRLSTTGQDVWLPHGSATFELFPKTHLTAAVGEYAQFPSLRDLYGEFGNPHLFAERALHESAALDQLFTNKIRLHAEFYNRQEREAIYSPQSEFRELPGGQVGYPQAGQVLANALNGYSRGFEISLQRRSANRLSGWVSYARGYSKYWQPGTTLHFWSDFDQRNTITAYGAYRLTSTISLSASGRYGSGLPIPGFFTGPPTGTPGSGSANTSSSTGLLAFHLSQLPNSLRLPAYQRVDLLLNKVFNREHFKINVYSEIANVLNHENWRYYDFLYPANIKASGLVYATRNTIMPILPTAGLTLEF